MHLSCTVLNYSTACQQLPIVTYLTSFGTPARGDAIRKHQLVSVVCMTICLAILR